MSAEIIVAIITGVFTLSGVIVTVISGIKRTEKQLQAQSELTLYRIEQLEKKQDKHNTLIERMYDLEEKVGIIEEKEKVSNHRISDLEKKVG